MMLIWSFGFQSSDRISQGGKDLVASKVNKLIMASYLVHAYTHPAVPRYNRYMIVIIELW